MEVDWIQALFMILSLLLCEEGEDDNQPMPLSDVKTWLERFLDVANRG